MIVYKYDTQTKEFIQELEINEAYGTNLPFTTTVKPLTKKEGFVICFNGAKWEYVEDKRGTVVYNKETKQESRIDYLGKIKDDVTTLNPEQFDKWDYDNNVWLLDLVAKDKYDLETKIAEANFYLKNTDWVETYKLRHDLGLELIPEESSKWVIINKREEYKLFLKNLEGGN